MTGTTASVDRPAAIRRALRDLVAERGFHGTSMGAVAAAAGVAAGTAYVHYASKAELVYATYLEIKRELGAAAIAAADPDAPPQERYRQMWMAAYRHLSAEPRRARFLTQLEESPYHETAHRLLLEQGDPLVEEAARPDIAELLVPLPAELLYSLSLGTAVRLVASDLRLDDAQLETLVAAGWRAITRERRTAAAKLSHPPRTVKTCEE
jgi:TetR/AcrR family transcriptional repressor of multidrug resistance operon